MTEKKARKIPTAAKTGTAGAVFAGAASYATWWLNAKYQIPAEVSAPVVGALGALLAGWAGKLQP